MTGEARSLLTFLPAPVAVGDPDGRAVYVNPAFSERFGIDADRVTGRPLAELFAGGGREAVLCATAQVCAHGREARFRLREAERGYAVLAAPIVAEGQTVGLVFLFWDESPTEGRVRQFHRELQDPLGDLAQCLDTLLEQTGGRRAERFRSHVEAGLRAAERIRKWSDELAAAVADRSDGPAAAPHCDPLLVARDVGQVLTRSARLAGQRFQQLLPAALPAVCGDGERLALALARFASERIEAAPEGSAFTLAAKVPAGDRCVLLSFTESVPREAASFALDDETPPASLRAIVDPAGGSVARVADPIAGVTTTLRLPLA